MTDISNDANHFHEALAGSQGRNDRFRPGFSRRDLFHGEADSNTIRLIQFAAGERVALEIISAVEEPVVHLTPGEAEALARELLARAAIARAVAAGEDVGDF
jgi:hypothetical protein